MAAIPSDMDNSSGAFAHDESTDSRDSSVTINQPNISDRQSNVCSGSVALQTDPKGNLLSILVPVRRTYIDEVPEDLKCPICLDSPVNCRTSCKHSFCFSCINGHINNRLRQQQAVSCPLCREAVTSNALATIQGEKSARVKGLRVACLGYICGCKETGLLPNMEIHEKMCPSVLIFCRFRERGCSTPLVRKDAILHECRCRFNPKVRSCKFHLAGCKVRGSDALLAPHEKKCKYRNMEKFVKCKFENLGCGLLIKKLYKERHGACCAFKLIHEMQNGVIVDAERQTSAKAECEEDSISMTDENAAIEENQSEMSTDSIRDIRLSAAWIKGRKAPIPSEELIKQISKFIPNVSKVQPGRAFGEFDIILKSIPATALRSIGMAIDPQLSCNFTNLGLVIRGLCTALES